MMLFVREKEIEGREKETEDNKEAVEVKRDRASFLQVCFLQLHEALHLDSKFGLMPFCRGVLKFLMFFFVQVI